MISQAHKHGIRYADPTEHIGAFAPEEATLCRLTQPKR